MIFKYENLIEFYKIIKNKGRTELFKNWKGDKAFLIRHDVDFDIKLAYDLALIENKLDIISTFFILTTCHSYNTLSSQNRTFLKEMIEMGHEIGLHFDPSIYNNDLELYVKREAEVLSFACGTEVKSISIHNPSVHGQYPIFKEYVNAYDPELFSDANYISDSCFDFRGKDPFEFINGIENFMIQITLHPMHFSEKGWGYDDIFANSFRSYILSIHESFKINRMYKKQIGNDILKIVKEKF